MTEDKMVGWYHRLDGHEFEQVPGVGDGQGCLACCGSWGHKESDTTERLNYYSPVAQMAEHLSVVRETRGSIPGLGRFPGGGNGNPFRYSCLENSMDRGGW